MSDTILNTVPNEAPNLELNDNFYGKVLDDYYELMCNKLPYSDNFATIFELGAQYAIANLKELVKPSSLLAFAEYLHKRYFIDDKQRTRLIEKFATMTFSNVHNPNMVIEALPSIEKMVDAILSSQRTVQPIIKAPSDEH